MALQVERWDSQKHGKLSSKTMLKRLRDEGYSGSTYQLPPGTHFPPHTHDCDKKDSIITGRFKFVSKDHGEVTLEPGDMLHVPRGMEHSAETVGTETANSNNNILCHTSPGPAVTALCWKARQQRSGWDSAAERKERNVFSATAAGA
ncbi:hypothetical protein WJX79_003447 [Trebouxia sp. C0005]